MNKKRRLIMLLVTLLPVAFFLVAASVYLYVQVVSLTHRLDVLVVDQLEQTYGREVRIGKVTTKPLGIAVIEDFDIGRKEFQRRHSAAVQARRDKIRLDGVAAWQAPPVSGCQLDIYLFP
jgi:hypothetical protein